MHMGAIMKRAALYMRVSTKGHGQTTETQALALCDYAAHRGFEIVEEYRDEGISGSKDSRPALDRLMKDARARKFDVVIVARFDRFARSVSHLLRALEEFSHLGIDFVSLSESIDTSTPMGKMIFTVLGAVAELERNLIRERVQMGISRARLAARLPDLGCGTKCGANCHVQQFVQQIQKVNTIKSGEGGIRTHGGVTPTPV